jgi:hypothetical protein
VPFFIYFLGGPVQLSAHLPKIQERREEIVRSPTYHIMCFIFCKVAVVNFIVPELPLSRHTTSAAGSSLAVVFSSRLGQITVLRVIVAPV